MQTPSGKNFKRTLVTSALPYANGDIGFDPEPIPAPAADLERFPLTIV